MHSKGLKKERRALASVVEHIHITSVPHSLILELDLSVELAMSFVR